MLVELREYSSAEEIAEKLDKEIGDTKSMLGNYLNKLDKIRTLAEKSKRIRELVIKLSGKKMSNDTLGEIEIGNLNIILDATPWHELTAIDSVVRSLQERLLVLQKARESMRPLDQLGDTEGVRYVVLENDGVPERILFKTS